MHSTLISSMAISILIVYLRKPMRLSESTSVSLDIWIGRLKRVTMMAIMIEKAIKYCMYTDSS